MELHADLTVNELRDAADFGSLKVVASTPSHMWIAREDFARLAGAQADDPSWRDGLEKMFAYAETKGWVNEDGAVRAHIEWS